MSTAPLTVQVKLDAKTFRSFAFFDAFIRRRGWRRPLVFALLMFAFAALCLLQRSRAPQARLLAAVLIGVGLVLPAGYLLSYSLSVRGKSRQLGLAQPKPVYDLTFDGDGVHVRAGKEAASYSWEGIHAAYLRPACIYLYVSPTRAFLLPLSQVPGGGQTLWDLLCAHLPSGRCFS